MDQRRRHFELDGIDLRCLFASDTFSLRALLCSGLRCLEQDRLEAEAKNQISRLQNELAQATGGTDLVKAEAGKHIESIKMEADARVDAVETEAKKRIDVIRRENEDKVLRLEADLTQAKNRADRAEQWVMLIRREIEEHLMPAMRDGPKPTSSVARRRSSTVPTPSRSLASIWFRPLWLRITTTATRLSSRG
jgi:hypothetical protein